jgi:hypothetical protein
MVTHNDGGTMAEDYDRRQIDNDIRLALLEETRLTREVADMLYANIWTQRLMFGLVALVLIGFITAVIALVVKS